MNQQYFSNEVIVQEIKHLLISRDSSDQLEGVKRLQYAIASLDSISQFELCEMFLKNDVIEVLCEVLCTTSAVVVHNVFRCFELFMNSKLCFEQSRIIYIIESVLRIIQVFISFEDQHSTISDCLKLILQIFSRVREHKTTLTSICNIPQILNVMSNILKCNSKYVVIITNIIANMLQLKEVNNYFFIMWPIVKQIISKLVNNLPQKCPELQILVSEVVKHSIRLLIVHKGIKVSSIAYLNSAFFVCYEAILKMVVPFFSESELNSSNFQSGITLLHGIHSIFLYSNKQINLKFSYHLIKMKFLSILQTLELSSEYWEDCLIVRSVLFEILNSLSENWLGQENWLIILESGLQTLPPKSKFCNFTLINSNRGSALTTIVFQYFNCLTNPRPEIELNFLSGLCIYIMSQKIIPSAAITKAVLFTFAVAFLNKQDQCIYAHTSAKCLIKFIMTYDTRVIYTHHPAILYWIFSTHLIRSDLKINVMKLWLEQCDNDKSIDVVKTLLQGNRDSCFIFLEILGTLEDRNTVNLLQCALFNNKSFCEEISEEAWRLIPKFLTICTPESKTNNFWNLTSLLNICVEYVPVTLEHSLVLRISCLIPGVIASHYLHSEKLIEFECMESYIIGFKFMLILFEKGLQNRDKRVFSPAIVNKQFLITIEKIIFLENDDLIIPVLEVISCLVNFQTITKIKSNITIELTTSMIHKMLSGNFQLVVTTLRLLAYFLNAITYSPKQLVFNITPPSATELRSLYIQIHIICSKLENNELSWCWICLHHLLKFSQQLNLHLHLSSLPLTHNLLVTCLPVTKTSKFMLTFLTTWIDFLPELSTTSLTSSRAQITFEEIAKTFLNNLNDEQDLKVQQIMSKVLKMQALPTSTGPLL